MSKLDITQQETLSLNVNQIHQDLPNIKESSLNEVDLDLQQALIEVFEEDQVKTLCCSGR